MERSRYLVRARMCAALLMLPLLSGCIAALAVPALTALGAISERNRNRAVALAALPAANAKAVNAEPQGERPAPSAGLTGLTELPPPSGSIPVAAGPWSDFSAYVLDRAAALAQGTASASALLTPESVLTFKTDMRPCVSREPAVVIDLDPGKALFAPGAARRVAPGAAEAARRLREAGVILLWVSQASANDVAGVAAALKESGLDPTGRDPILLVRNEDERKQVLREEANQTVCVLAIAGDQRGDFDELFDYLRDPRLATAYDAQIGSGWFLLPPPFEPGAEQPGTAGAQPAEGSEP